MSLPKTPRSLNPPSSVTRQGFRKTKPQTLPACEIRTLKPWWCRTCGSGQLMTVQVETHPTRGNLCLILPDRPGTRSCIAPETLHRNKHSWKKNIINNEIIFIDWRLAQLLSERHHSATDGSRCRNPQQILLSDALLRVLNSTLFS